MVRAHALRRSTTVRLILSAAALLALGLLFLLRSVAGDAFYALYIPFSKALMWALSWLFSPLPFSVAEAGIVLGGGTLLVLFFVFLLRAILGGDRERVNQFGRYCAGLLCAACILLFCFYLLWGMSYGAPRLAESMGLDVRNRGSEELFSVAEQVAAEINDVSASLPRAEDGTLAEVPFLELSRRTADAFSAYTGRKSAPAKRILLSVPLSYTYTTGIFIDFTGEANVNANSTVASLPFVMAHEMSHRFCISSEDETNFFAFVSLRERGDPLLRYSALFSAWQYLSTRLSSADHARFVALHQSLDAGARADYNAYILHWDRYEGTTATVSQQINNGYLIAQGETDGVKSYGRMVDLLLAYYLKDTQNAE